MPVHRHCVLVIIGSILLLSLSSNPPQGNSGAPFDGSCNRFGCHFTGGFLNGSVEIMGVPDKVERGASYDLEILIRSTIGSPVRAGFQMVAVDPQHSDSGEFSEPGLNSTLSSFNDRTYFEHQPASLFGDADTVFYHATWTAPTDFINQEFTTFYVSSILANGSNSPTGDTYLSTSYTVQLKIDSTTVEDCQQSIHLMSPDDDVDAGEHVFVTTNTCISSSAKVNAQGRLSLNAINGISLTKGFEVMSNAEFVIRNDGCSND